MVYVQQDEIELYDELGELVSQPQLNPHLHTVGD